MNVSFWKNVVYVLNEQFLSFATKQKVPVLEGYLERSETSMIEHFYELHYICLRAFISREIIPRFSENAHLLNTFHSNVVKELHCDFFPESFTDLDLKA